MNNKPLSPRSDDGDGLALVGCFLLIVAVVILAALAAASTGVQW